MILQLPKREKIEDFEKKKVVMQADDEDYKKAIIEAIEKI